jgi:hypothetical protein
MLKATPDGAGVACLRNDRYRTRPEQHLHTVGPLFFVMVDKQVDLT